jgi:hypothetical protein
VLGNPRQAYTWPDGTHNKLAFVNLGANTGSRARRCCPARSTIAGSQQRHQQQRQRGLDEPDSPPAFNVDSTIDAKGYGGALQLSLGSAAMADNRLTLGVAADLGDANFRQSSQPAVITAQRETVGDAPFHSRHRRRCGGATVRGLRGDTYVCSIRLQRRYRCVQTMRALRFPTARKGTCVERTSTYRRLNRAGATWNITERLHGLRETGARQCASDSGRAHLRKSRCARARCRNIFVADPPLQPVIGTPPSSSARRDAWGTRERARGGWSAAVFRTDLRNDILFVAAGSGAANSGYFRNVGRTRREGFELAASGYVRFADFVARTVLYSRDLRDRVRRASPNNSTAGVDGTIVVNPGDSIRGFRHGLLKLLATWSPLPSLDIGGSADRRCRFSNARR